MELKHAASSILLLQFYVRI